MTGVGSSRGVYEYVDRCRNSSGYLDVLHPVLLLRVPAKLLRRRPRRFRLFWNGLRQCGRSR